MPKILIITPIFILSLLWLLSRPSLGNEALRFDPSKRAVILVTKETRTTELLQMHNGVQRVFITSNAIGSSKTETPTGRYEVEAVILGALWASPDGTIFRPGQHGYPLGGAVITIRGQLFALHGTNLPNLIGQKISHGCIRNRDILTLAHDVVPGTIVYIQEHPQEANLLLEDFDWQSAHGTEAN